MKYLENSKSISLIIALMMILQLVLPYGFADADETLLDVVPIENITKVTVTAENDEGVMQNIADIDNYRPKNGDKITLKADIKLEAWHDFKNGAKLTYPLPAIFEDASGSGNLGTVGTFEIVGGEVVCTFDDIRDGSNQGLEVDNASFSIDAEYSQTNELLEYTLELPGQDTIVLNFKPVGGQSISKTGVAENGGLSSNYVTWTVDVNTELNTLKDAQIIDELIQKDPGKHTFDKSTVKAYELTINATGEVTQSTTEVAITAVVATTTSTAITATYNVENTEATFSLPDGKKAYRIVYQSKINENDSNEGKATYENKASFTNNGVTVPKTDSVTVNWGSPLEKSVSRSNRYGESAYWTVNYNYNRKTIVKAEAFIVDRITGNHVIYVTSGSGIKVYDENSIEIASNLYTVTLDADKMGYKLQFENDVNQPYQIKYTTVRSDYLFTSGKVSNTATRGNDDKTASASFNYANPAIDKIAMGIDYNEKTIKWGIKVNRDSYPMKNIIIEDIYNGEGMEYINGTLLVSGLTSDQYTFVDNALVGFTFSTTSGAIISNPFTITFKTDYTIENVGTNDRNFKNTANIEWDIDGTVYTSSGSAIAKIDDKQKKNGYKNGTYNYETKEFNWEALINFNNNTLNDAIFKDSLPEGQEVNIGSIIVQPVTLNADGSNTPVGAPITSSSAITSSAINSFEISLGTITGPYLITYTSVDEDGFFPKTLGKVKIKNSAELWDGTVKNAEWSDTVTVAYTDETITKFGSGVNNTSSIDWNFKLNYSQSELSDVKVVDTVGKDAEDNPNQLVLEDSFKVYEVTLTGDINSGNPVETKVLVAENSGIYTVVFDKVNGTFTLEFPGTIEKAYYVEYRSIFLGAPNDDVSNEANLTYKHLETYSEKSVFEIIDYYFNGSGSTKKVGLKLIKTNASGEKLEGAKFSLHNVNDINLFEGTTDSDGILSLPYKIGEGEYTLREDEAPSGYFTNDDLIIDLKLSSAIDGVQTVNIIDEKSEAADIKLIKHDESGSPLAGAEFTLYKDGNIVGSPVTSNTNGEVTFKDIDLGTYTIKETKAPNGYDSLNSIITVLIESNNTLKKTEVSFNGTIYTEPFSVNNGLVDVDGDIVINKTDNADNPLAGAEFTIYDSGQNAIKTAISGSDGKVEFQNMNLGTYTIKETKAPDGHYKSSLIVVAYVTRNANLVDADVELRIDGKIFDDVTVVNDAINIKIDKVDKYDRPLSDAEFTLYNDNDEVVQVIKTNALGEAEFTQVSIGNYTIKETKAPSGYYVSDKVVNVEVKATAEPEGKSLTLQVDETLVYGAVVFVDEKIPNVIPTKGKIVIEKIDENNNVLAGAKFTLYDSQGTVVKTGITDAEGLLSFVDIPLGDYELKETEAPSGYLLSEKDLYITIENEDIQIHVFSNEKETTSLPDEIDVTEPTDPIIRGNISISKIDEDEQPLEGAEFGLYDESGNLIETMISGADGKVVFTDLSKGGYSVKEIDAPIGYELYPQRKVIEITESKTYAYKFVNVSDETILENPDIPGGWIEIDDPIIPEGSIELPDTGSVFNMWA